MKLTGGKNQSGLFMPACFFQRGTNIIMPEATMRKIFFSVKPPEREISDQHNQSQISTNRIKPANLTMFIINHIPWKMICRRDGNREITQFFSNFKASGVKNRFGRRRRGEKSLQEAGSEKCSGERRGSSL